jgi:hypothetical protein
MSVYYLPGVPHRDPDFGTVSILFSELEDAVQAGRQQEAGDGRWRRIGPHLWRPARTATRPPPVGASIPC